MIVNIIIMGYIMEFIKISEILSENELNRLPEGIGDLKIPSRFRDGKKEFFDDSKPGKHVKIKKDWNDYVLIGKTKHGGIMEIVQPINVKKDKITEYDANGKVIHSEKRILRGW